MKLGVSIYTYDKIQEACIQMEVIRELRSKFFDEIIIVHTYNGNPQDYPKKYLEDELIYMDNPGHYQGAAEMMDAGVETLLKYGDLDYIIVNASDVWWIDPNVLTNIIKNMKKFDYVIGSCPWGSSGQDNRKGVGLACDTFFLDAKRENRYHIFPLNWKNFYDKYIDLIRYMGKTNVSVEGLFASKYVTACSRVQKRSDYFTWIYANEHVYTIKERMPTILDKGERNFDIPTLGLYTNHDLNIKKKILIDNNLIFGKYSKEFIS